MSFELIIIVIGLIVLFGAYGTYVSVIQAKNKVQEAASGVDVQLKKRYDLIPNMLKIAKSFMEHEKEIFTKITELRSQAMQLSSELSDMNKKIELDKQIRSEMGKFMVSVENYPALKSDGAMMSAMNAYADTEEHIAAARRFYNSAVLILNNKVEIFPSSIIAGMLGIKKQEFFQAEEVERKSIDANEFLR